jgi:hypothetical protein
MGRQICPLRSKLVWIWPLGRISLLCWQNHFPDQNIDEIMRQPWRLRLKRFRDAQSRVQFREGLSCFGQIILKRQNSKNFSHNLSFSQVLGMSPLESCRGQGNKIYIFLLEDCCYICAISGPALRLRYSDYIYNLWGSEDKYRSWS